MRSRVDEFTDFVRRGPNEPLDVSVGQALRVAIGDPAEVRRTVSPLLSDDAMEKLSAAALDAVEGRVCCFGRWSADFGHEISWHRSPRDGTRWDAKLHGTRILRNLPPTDVKLVWEVARFPQAYVMARAAAFRPELAQELSDSLAEQIRSFCIANQFGRGVHWASSQEAVFRIMAWLFAYRIMDALGSPLDEKLITNALYETALHTDRYIAYAKRCVYNNHLLSEAFGLLLGGILLPTVPRRRNGAPALSKSSHAKPPSRYLMMAAIYKIPTTTIDWRFRFTCSRTPSWDMIRPTNGDVQWNARSIFS